MKLDAHNPRVLVNEVIREHIRSCGSRIGSVVFYKKDGSLRRMRFQLAAGKDKIKGTERGKQASATKALNHPELLTVYEIGNHWRTINLDTVVTVQSARKVTRYRDVLPVAPGRYVLAPIVYLKVGIEEPAS